MNERQKLPDRLLFKLHAVARVPGHSKLCLRHAHAMLGWVSRLTNLPLMARYANTVG